MSKKVAVIGSGFAGMSAAAYLAKKGFDVSLYEKNEGPGGRARLWEKDGFVFDLGPSWYWMPEVFEKFYNDFGYKTADFYQLDRLDPSYRVYFEENHIDIPATLEALYTLFETKEKGSGMRLEKFLKDASYKYTTAMNDYVNRPSHSIFEFMELHLLIKAFKMNLFSPIRKEVKQVVSDAQLTAILEFPVLFLGATPANTPALYSMMNHADLTLGTWYPQGGMHEISKAFMKVATDAGVKFYFNQEVTAINIKGNKAQSITTNQSEFEVDFVVAAGDYHYIEQHLLPATHRRYTQKYWDNRTMSPSSLLFYLGVNKKVAGLLHHNLFFDEDFNVHAHEIYTAPQWPSKPLFYACVPSITDEKVAPDGMENIFLLMPLAPGLEDSEEMRSHYFKVMIERLEQKTNTSLKNNIIVNRSYCLSDFKNDYHSFKGNAYGLANTLKQTAFLKPAMRSNKVSNLLYAGQLTVPGPGVPPAIISGRMVANEASAFLKKNL